MECICLEIEYCLAEVCLLHKGFTTTFAIRTINNKGPAPYTSYYAIQYHNLIIGSDSGAVHLHYPHTGEIQPEQ